MSAPVTLTRDCEAIQIPYGNALTAREGTVVVVTQALGDTFTVRTQQGYLLRIDAKDADALGMSLEAAQAQAQQEENKGPVAPVPVDEQKLWELLRTCYDPEIPANIVDIGLIYSCRSQPIKADDDFSEGSRVAVEMTLTAPGCGMGQVLHDDVVRKLSQVEGVAKVDVRLVFDPPWDIGMMSEAARLELGMF